MGHVTLTTTILGVVFIHQLGHDMVYLCIKFDDSRFGLSRDINGAQRFNMGHVTLTTPILRVICHPYAGT